MMGMPSKVHNIWLLQIQPGGRLAATSELNLASSLVTVFGEAKGMECWASYTENDRGALLKSRMMETFKYGSMRGLMASFGENNTKRGGI